MNQHSNLSAPLFRDEKNGMTSYDTEKCMRINTRINEFSRYNWSKKGKEKIFFLRTRLRWAWVIKTAEQWCAITAKRCEEFSFLTHKKRQLRALACKYRSNKWLYLKRNKKNEKAIVNRSLPFSEREPQSSSNSCVINPLNGDYISELWPTDKIL